MAPPTPLGPRAILVGTALLYVGALVLFYRSTETNAALAFSPEGFQSVGQTLAPLLAISAFLERAVEIVVASSRAPGALERHRDLEAARDPVQWDEAHKALRLYKLQTQRFSFAVGLGLALFASLVGVRAISPLLAPGQHHPRGFDLFDVILTSLLLAGGSDGVHQIVTTITMFLDVSKSIQKQKMSPPPPPLPTAMTTTTTTINVPPPPQPPPPA